ncbi:MAG: hypothetical protein WD669_09620 [Pirellulales bacterium]
MDESAQVVGMGSLGLGKRFAGGIGDKEFFASDADTSTAMQRVNRSGMGLKPSRIAIKLLALGAGSGQLSRVCQFFHDDRW